MLPTQVAFRGKLTVITGASSGIGKETALGLARLGGRLVLLCRDAGRAEAAVAEIRRKVAGTEIEIVLADLASQAEVRRAAAALAARHARIDVLVHNAGIIVPTRRLTADGVEHQLAVNHLAPFLLTHLLLDRLRSAAPARIVVVASQVEARGQLEVDDLSFARRAYEPLAAYAQSKLANVLFTYELARRLEGTGVTANCLHPGVIATNLLSDFLGRPRVLGFLNQVGHPGPDKGAKTSIFLAADPGVEQTTGRYFREQREAPSSPASYDRELARRLWDKSAELTQVA
jgi:NAD(P)-dependent dehydrogenase (short-subunit alcohol dehydrogenase family)